MQSPMQLVLKLVVIATMLALSAAQGLNVGLRDVSLEIKSHVDAHKAAPEQPRAQAGAGIGTGAAQGPDPVSPALNSETGARAGAGAGARAALAPELVKAPPAAAAEAAHPGNIAPAPAGTGTGTGTVGAEENKEEREGNELEREDEYFQPIAPLDPQRSAALLSQLPVAYYFDALAGKFRLGLIGETLRAHGAELVSAITKRVMLKGKRKLDLQNVPVVDVHTVFMHGLSVVQGLSRQGALSSAQLSRIETGVERELQQTHDISALFEQLRDELPIDVQLQVESVQLNTRWQELLREREAERRDLKLATFRKRMAGRLALREEQHTQLLKAALKHLDDVEAIKRAGLQELANIRGEFEQSKHATEVSTLRQGLANSVRKLRGEIKSIIAATEFRVKEEVRLEQETEETASKVLKAKSDMETAEIEKLVDSVSAEITKAVVFAMGNSSMMLKGAAVLLLAIISIVVVVEAATVTRSVFFQMSKRNIPFRFRAARHAHAHTWASVLSKITQQGADIAPSPLLERVVLSEPLREAFASTSRAIREAGAHGACLPYVLVRGSAGTGKSFGADALVYDAGVAYATIHASEVLALGEKSALFLFDFLHRIQTKSAGAPTMVIVDGVDELVLKRQAALDCAGFTESCFYVLLQIMRNPSTQLGVILTTKLALAEVDPAILDRIDSVLEMPLPTQQQRLAYASSQAAVLLAPYVEASALAALVASQVTSKADPCASSSSSSSSSRRRRRERPEQPAEDCSSSPETDVPETTGKDNGNRNRNRNRSRSRSISSSTLSSLVGNLQVDTDAGGTGTSCTELAQELAAVLSHSTSSTSSTTDPDLQQCLEALAGASAGWSYRELDKVLHGVVGAVLGTVDCRVSQRVFLLEVQNALQEKQLQQLQLQLQQQGQGQ